jgi:acyl-CoA thioester hydrolase
MPHTFTRSFDVPYYECDAFGHLNNAVYLRYIQESAFSASADAGYDREAYQSMGRTWFIRETELDYLRPVKAEDTIDVRTWISGVRRVIVRREYELSNVATGELVAKGHTDWVFLNQKTGRPTTIPREIIDAYLPEDVAEESLKRHPFPPTPPPPNGIFKIQRKIEWRDIDAMQHLTNAAYLSYLEECGVRLLEAYGWPMSSLLEENTALVARRLRIEYLQPALFEDELEIATWIVNVRPATIKRYYTVSRLDDGTLLAQALTDWVMMDLQTERPMRIRPSFIEILAPNISQTLK